MERLEAVMRLAYLLKRNIEANGDRYDPMLAPNFQSLFDAGVGLSNEQFEELITEERLLEAEQATLPRFSSLKWGH